MSTVIDDMARALVRKHRDIYPGAGWPALEDARTLVLATLYAHPATADVERLRRDNEGIRLHNEAQAGSLRNAYAEIERLRREVDRQRKRADHNADLWYQAEDRRRAEHKAHLDSSTAAEKALETANAEKAVLVEDVLAEAIARQPVTPAGDLSDCDRARIDGVMSYGAVLVSMRNERRARAAFTNSVSEEQTS